MLSTHIAMSSCYFNKPVSVLCLDLRPKWNFSEMPFDSKNVCNRIKMFFFLLGFRPKISKPMRPALYENFKSPGVSSTNMFATDLLFTVVWSQPRSESLSVNKMRSVSFIVWLLQIIKGNVFDHTTVPPTFIPCDVELIWRISIKTCNEKECKLRLLLLDILERLRSFGQNHLASSEGPESFFLNINSFLTHLTLLQPGLNLLTWGII